MTTITATRPAFLTQNTYFWRAGSSAGQRRSNERRRHSQVADWLESLGFTVTQDGDTTRGYRADDDCAVAISYRESCHNVYCHKSVSRHGKRSNLSILH